MERVLSYGDEGQRNIAAARAADESVERLYESEELPSWQKQLTLRAFIVRFFLAVPFTFIMMKLKLTAGIVPPLNISAGLLRFFFVKSATKFLEKCGFVMQPFTRQENCVVQTCVIASSGIAYNDQCEYCLQDCINRFVRQLCLIKCKDVCPPPALLKSQSLPLPEPDAPPPEVY